MTLRAGSYSHSIWHGVLREDGSPWYVCTHRHDTRDEAKQCARQAKRIIDTAPPNDPLPLGWVHYHPGADL